ncbi:MAG: type II toxin-antitoxin system VapC family toxin [Sporichthyaceae bacterium]
MDTSALLKRVVVEAESSAVRVLLRERHLAGDLLTSSSLAWLEIWRSLRRADVVDVEDVVASAMSGVAEYPLDDTILRRARRVGPDEMRSLDAIHLASALAIGADAILTYDRRLADAAAAMGLAALAPNE